MDVPTYIFTVLVKAGMTKEGACAVLGNLQAESAFRANNVEDRSGIVDEEYTSRVNSGIYSRAQFMSDGFGYGLAQWTYCSRKGLMWDYFKEHGKQIDDLQTQVEFIIWEMKHYFSTIWDMLCSSTDLYACTWKLLDVWENPDGKMSKIAERYSNAKNWLSKLENQNVQKKGASGMTKQEAVKKVLDLARSEIGYREKASNSGLDDKTANAGGANWTKYARDLDRTNWYNGGKNGYAWCDIFYDWLFYKCFGDPLGRNMLCQPIGSAGAGCLYSAQYYKSAGRWHTNSPQPGDQIFFTYSPGEYSHTGIVEQVNGDTVTTIEGNTSDSVGRRNYNVGSPQIAGYGRPNWDLATGKTVPDEPVITDTPAMNYPLLKKGARGEWVKKLQEMLVAAGYDVGPDGPDGDFGTNTYYAVRRFQIEHNLEVDGEVGNNTWEALEKADKKQEKPAPDKSDEESIPKAKLVLPVLKEDTEDGLGPYVKLAQSALACWGYTIVIHGIFGKEMTHKVKDFQEKKGLEPDGEIGYETWKALLNISI